jgi:hypothetical protein
MRKAYSLLLMGIWVTVLPYLGFPYSWKDILTAITGLGLIFFSYMLYREYKSKESKVESFDNFSENQFIKDNETE